MTLSEFAKDVGLIPGDLVCTHWDEGPYDIRADLLRALEFMEHQLTPEYYYEQRYREWVDLCLFLQTYGHSPEEIAELVGPEPEKLYA